MGAHVFRQVAGLGAGLPADATLKEKLASRFTPLPLARPFRFQPPPFTSRLIPSPLAPEHRQIRRHVFRETDLAKLVKPKYFSGISGPICNLKDLKNCYTFALGRDHPGLLGHWNPLVGGESPHVQITCGISFTPE